jgi:hypothetical protein
MKRGVAAAVLLGLVAFGAALAFTPPRGPRSIRIFNPNRLADLEVGMWKAYYDKERVRLFSLLVTMLHEQYRYSWATATTEAFHLVKAAATFGDLKENYDIVLPDLESAYRTAKSWLGAGFDPPAVARAELAWWVARRIPGENSAEQIGTLMAHEYALLYETSPEVVGAAALLRAEAAKLRDNQADHPDWAAITELLQQSYRELLLSLSSVNV